jgi:hypothetical protein
VRERENKILDKNRRLWVPDIFRIKILADLADPFWRTRQRTRQRKPAKPARRSSCDTNGEIVRMDASAVLERYGGWRKEHSGVQKTTSESRAAKKQRTDPIQFWVFSLKIASFLL